MYLSPSEDPPTEERSQRPIAGWAAPFVLGCLLPFMFSVGHYFGHRTSNSETVTLVDRCGLQAGSGMLLCALGDREAVELCPPGFVVLRKLELSNGRFAVYAPQGLVVRRSDRGEVEGREEDR